MHALTQRSEHRRAERRRGRVGARLGDAERRRRAERPLRALALGAGYSAAIAVVNRLGHRPGRARASPAPRCAAATCTACARCSGGCDRRRAHVIWGHSHRSGPWPGDDPAEWTHAGRRAHPQHRLVGLRAALPRRVAAAPLAVLAGHGRRWSRTARRRGSSACWRPRARRRSGHARREAGGVDARRPARPRARARPRCGAGARSARRQPGPATATARPFTRSSPAPSTTAHTPPAS